MRSAVVAVTPATTKLSGLAWSAFILGIVGLVGSPVIIFNNLTAIAAGVGLILGLIAVFGIGAIPVTVAVRKAAVGDLDQKIDELDNSLITPAP